jgi:FMN reductase
MQVVSLSGSPSPRSRSAWLLDWAVKQIEPQAGRARSLSLRDLPALPLLTADVRQPSIAEAIAAVREADVVLVGTPIYKAAYSGLLKTFLDLLPQDALRGKTVLPLATGGSPAHLLAIDYALRPVLHALGARQLLDGVFVTDSQMPSHEVLGYLPDEAVVERLSRALAPVHAAWPTLPRTHDAQLVEAARC